MKKFTPDEEAILRSMHKHGRPMSIGEIARDLLKSPTATAGYLRNLEKKGAITSEIRNNKRYYLLEYF